MQLRLEELSAVKYSAIMANRKENLLQQFYAHLKEIYDLKGISQLLGWDQRVCMPEKGSPARARQIALVEKEIHLRYLQEDFYGLINDLLAIELNYSDSINVREVQRDVERKRKIPAELTERYSEACALTETAWEKARPLNDFAVLEPLLDNLIVLSREHAERWGYPEHPYDALLQSFEPGSTLTQTRAILMQLTEGLKAILPTALKKSENVTPLSGNFPVDAQRALCAQVIQDVGYGYDVGRLDVAPHPFSATISAGDSRVTTRYCEENYLSSVLTALHEVGHGFYELGFSPENEGSPLAEYVSMGIHESQSLLWENFIGRSFPFCQYLHPLACAQLGVASDPEAIYEQLNIVQRSLIRVEADRVTYPLHIVIRMLLEEQLIEGSLAVKDLPEAWDALYLEYLDIAPPDDRDGVLQDVHWYGGMFGYFPSYALGQIYAAMLFEKIGAELPDLASNIASGQFSELLNWLQTHIHRRGRTYEATELIKVVTGKSVSEKPLLSYLAGQYLD